MGEHWADNRGHPFLKPTAATIVGDFPPLVEHFDELMQQIISGQTILAVSDGSYLEDGRASVGWALYELSEEYDSHGRLVPSVKLLFGSTTAV